MSVLIEADIQGVVFRVPGCEELELLMFGVVFCFGVSVLRMHLWQHALSSVSESYVCGDFA